LSAANLKLAKENFDKAEDFGTRYKQALDLITKVRDKTTHVTPDIDGVSKSSADAFLLSVDAYKKDPKLETLNGAYTAYKTIAAAWKVDKKELKEFDKDKEYYDEYFEYKDNKNPKYKHRLTFEKYQTKVNTRLDTAVGHVKVAFEGTERPNPEHITQLEALFKELESPEYMDHVLPK
jgi:uncharacterized protein YktA (UPF0223 family)